MSSDLRAIVLDQNRRSSPRHEVLDGALTLTQDRPDAICCVVKDMSDTGARIVLVGEACVIPSQFRLYIPEQETMAYCEQVWQKGNDVGLKFVGLANIGKAPSLDGQAGDQ